MSRWIAAAIEDCLNGALNVDAAMCALVVSAPDVTRPDMRADPYWEIITGAAGLLGLTFHESSCILPLGSAGLAQALSQASQILPSDNVQHGLLVAGDSLLDARAIGFYLAQERLLIPGNRDGLIPGEAAGALLLTAGPPISGSVVIPYVNTAHARKLKNGTKTVFICKTPAALRDVSFLEKSIGNEPATKMFQKGVATRVIKGMPISRTGRPT